MTRKLELGIDRVSALPDNEQDAIASMILAEIEDDARWRAAFAKSQVALARLADEARAEITAGEIRAYDPASKPE